MPPDADKASKSRKVEKARKSDAGGKPRKSEESDSLSEFVNAQIEGLRPKLLDLSRRNPLVSAPFSDRSTSLVRVVDEVPTILFEKLMTGSMRLVALPPLDDDPKDEMSEEFQDALAEGRLVDEAYLARLDGISGDDENSADKLNAAERELKDRIRGQLGLPQRQTKSALSLVQHARNNHIRPSYDLPIADKRDDDERHSDEDIQTLLLPDIFVRRLNSINTKCRTWLQETGISVSQLAFGFLEWAESEGSAPSFAPLILMPSELIKERTPRGLEFWVKGDDAVSGNIVLAEKLKSEFGIDVPKYDPSDSIEGYFEAIQHAAPVGRRWRVRRQVAVGVFPSARMAMYYDLDTKKFDLGKQSTIRSLFGGNTGEASATPYGDDYEIDDPSVESKVPVLVMDADSSQFSTIVDVMDEKNMAVEGPPGTGKSQTIVNTIASAIADGRKVLFVAEKTAALDVVRSRLEAVGLREFLLPLLANRSGRSQVIGSIRERVRLEVPKSQQNADQKLDQFKRARAEMSEYIDVIKKVFGDTGITNHDVLGRYIKIQDDLKGLPDELFKHVWPQTSNITDPALDELLAIAEEVEVASETCAQVSETWSKVGISDVNPFHLSGILELSEKCGEKYDQLVKLRDRMTEFDLKPGYNAKVLGRLSGICERIGGDWSTQEIALINRIFESDASTKIAKFLEDIGKHQEWVILLSDQITNITDDEVADDLGFIRATLKELQLEEISLDLLRNYTAQRQGRAAKLHHLIGICEESLRLIPEAVGTPVKSILDACHVSKTASRETLGLRSESFDDPAVIGLIERAADTCRRLNGEKSNLDELMTVNDDQDLGDINRHLVVLSSPGFFRFFSQGYRRAKRYYRGLSKRRKFQEEIASDDLRRLFEWHKDARNFNNDHRLQNLLGFHFDGLNSNFDAPIATLNYYKTVDERLSGLSSRPLREFLKNASIDSVVSLPVVAEELFTVPSNTEDTESIRKERSDLTTELLDLDDRVSELLGRLSRLKSPEGTTLDSLDALSQDFDDYRNHFQHLEQSPLEDVLGADYFRGVKTNALTINRPLNAARIMAKVGESFARRLLSVLSLGRMGDLIELMSNIVELDDIAATALSELADAAESTPEKLIGSKTPTKIAEWSIAASNDKEGLHAYARLRGCRTRLSDAGYDFLIESFDANCIPVGRLRTALKGVVCSQMARDLYTDYGDILSKFDGAHLTALRRKIGDLDRQIIQLSRAKLRSEVNRNASPPGGVGFGPKRDWTEMHLLNNEINKKRAYVSSRDLTKRAGKALLELKPCWLMSPLSVAQYIDKGSLTFDLVIIDEASQMRPEDAIGALVRGNQAMIVGDTNQLPPTSFFKKMIAVDEDEDDPDVVTEESILERANGAFRPIRRLRWHYRSRHSGLIQFSNYWIYDNELVVFPSPNENHPNMGVCLVKVDGEYASGTNPKEARTMVKAIADFIRTDPGRSIGVVTVNQKQRDLLIDEFEYLAGSDRKVSQYLDYWEQENDGLESFFIKNLENVQGDERDVMFIGTVYGPERSGGGVMQRFGPISGIAGKRRLNVLFTRAKEKIVTFSSMTASDIKSDENQNQGAHLLKRWLEYSASGYLDSGTTTVGVPDSPFEEFVIDQIKVLGCEPIPQVGVRGYSIDIGVRHPHWPNGFLMGVECDGATYHSSRSARDRDRIRQEVLENLGWHLHRIWSTDWFNNPARERERLKQAIEDRVAELQETVVTEPAERDRAEPQINNNSHPRAKTENLLADTEIQNAPLFNEPTSEKFLDSISEDHADLSEGGEDAVTVRRLSQEDARKLLINLREHVIDEELPDSDRSKGLLRKKMLDVLLQEFPTVMDEFHARVPLFLRETIDPQQIKYLPDVFEILGDLE